MINDTLIYMYIILIFLTISFIKAIFDYLKPHQEETLKMPKEIPYYRDIPTKKLDLAYWIGIKYNLIEDKYDFIGVLLLKWLKENKIKLIKKNKKIYIDFNTHFKTPNNYERDFYHKFLSIAGTNHILEEHEFINYVLYHKDSINKLFENLFEDTEEYLLNNKLIAKKVVWTKEKIKFSPELEEIAINIHGLKKYLEDFSNIQEKKAEEVLLWDYYLIYAQLFGMTDKLQTELKNIYPDQFKINSIFYTDVSIIGAMIMSIKMGINLVLDDNE